MRYDVVVVGSGMAGVCAALQAARLGRSVVIIEKEMCLGGNWGINLGVGATGALHNNAYYNETGIVSEIESKLTKENARIAEDVLSFNLNPKWDSVISEMLTKAGVTILRKHLFYDLIKDEKIIKSVLIKNIETLKDLKIYVDGFVIDASGDGVVADKADALYMIGREGQDEYHETCAPLIKDDIICAASLTAITVNTGKNCQFTPPKGTPDWNPCKPANSFNPNNTYNILFQIDEGGENTKNHPLYSPQELYQNLVSKMYSIWDYFKNVLYVEEAKTHQLVWISPILGKRETRRILGEYVLNQNDVEESTIFPDAVTFGGFLLDEHPPSSDGGYETRFFGNPVPYDIPLRSLYSKNIDNLLFAGRNASVSHVVFTSTRVIRTGGAMGQAIGLAASYCLSKKITPKELSEKDILNIKREILHNDGNIIGVKLEEENNLINNASISASSCATLSHNILSNESIIGENIGVCIYDIPTHIDTIKVYVFNKTKSIQKCMLSVGYGKTPNNSFVSKNKDGQYSFAYPNRQDYISKFDSIIEVEKSIEAGYIGWIEFDIYKNFESKKERKDVNEGLLIAINTKAEVGLINNHLDVIEGMKKKDDRWELSNHLMAFSVEKEYFVGSEQNIKDGYIHREGLTKLHQWVSALDQSLPQSICIDFKKEVTFNKILIRFDETLKKWFDMHHFKYNARPKRLVKDFNIYVINGQKKELIYEENNNYFRLKQINFAKTIKASKLQIEIVDVNEDHIARIYDIGVYNI